MDERWHRAEVDTPVPFRWNLAKREQLGRLVGDEPWPAVPYLDELREISAKVVARAGDADLVFVGRSPEKLFDYLSGVFGETRAKERLTLFQLSHHDSRADGPAEMVWLGGYLIAERLSPHQIVERDRPIRFVDLVAWGGTFHFVLALMQWWAKEYEVPWNECARRIGFIGLTRQEKNSPNTWRWYQKPPWSTKARDIPASSVSISSMMWDVLCNDEPKVTHSFPNRLWGTNLPAIPPRDERKLQGLRLALSLYDTGSQRAERQNFAASLAQQHEFRQPFVRTLAHALKSGS